MMGIKPDELNAYHFFESTHLDDVEKHAYGRSKMSDLANDLFRAKKGSAMLPINIRIRNAQNNYHDLLFQLYFVYSKIPYETLFLFQVHTLLIQKKEAMIASFFCIDFSLKKITYFLAPGG